MSKLCQGSKGTRLGAIIYGKRGSSSGFSTNSAPRLLRDYDDAIDFFGVLSLDGSGAYNQWELATTQDERDSVTKYTSSYYSVLNGILRKGNSATAEDQKHIKNIDKAISEFVLTDKITVFRGSGTHLINGYSTVEEINKNLKGAIVQDKGYMSTASVKGNNFSGEIMYEITVTPGKGKGAFIAPISHFDKQEIEFLLKRGSKFRVEGARSEKGKPVVSLTVVS